MLANCCAQEKYYNPFYALLGQKLCEYKDDFKYTFQFTLWDHINNLHRYTLRKVNNLARLAAEMIHTFALPLAALKGLEFEHMSQYQIIFLNIILEELFNKYVQNIPNYRAESELLVIFQNLSRNRNASSFQDNLYFYLEHSFLPKTVKKYEKEDPEKMFEIKAKLETVLKVVPDE